MRPKEHLFHFHSPRASLEDCLIGCGTKNGGPNIGRIRYVCEHLQYVTSAIPSSLAFFLCFDPCRLEKKRN